MSLLLPPGVELVGVDIYMPGNEVLEIAPEAVDDVSAEKCAV